MHQSKIIAGGTSYFKRVPNIDKLLKALDLNRAQRKGLCKKLATETRYEDFISEFLRLNPNLKIPQSLFVQKLDGITREGFVASLMEHIQ